MKSIEPVPTGADDTIDVIALWRLLWRHKILIAAVAAVFCAVSIVLALSATPIYRAQTVLTPVADTGLGGGASSLAGRFGGLASLAGIDLGSGGVASQEARAVLESRNLLEQYIRRNKLVDELAPAGIAGSSLWYAVENFRNTVVAVQADDLDGTVTVAVEWKDPAVAANWANGIVALANELMRAKALANSSRNIDYLNKQVATTNVVELQRVLFELIKNETKTMMLANARAEYAFTVVDPAVVAEARVRPKRRLMVLTGTALGLIIAALFVFGRDTVLRYRARESADGVIAGS